MDKGLGLTETEIGVGPNSPVPMGTRIDLADSFRTSNHFNGGDLGVDAEVRRGSFYVDLLARVALGDTSESVGISGNTSIQGAAPLPGGFLALPTNGGSFHKDQFAVVPEVGLTVGYQVTECLRVFTGYTFLYWSNVARPGDQVDLAINPSQLPPGRLVGPARPAFTLHDTDFWAQGINFGAELRF
jgi:hypothetical protein